jgi:hypothetical protein
MIGVQSSVQLFAEIPQKSRQNNCRAKLWLKGRNSAIA